MGATFIAESGFHRTAVEPPSLAFLPDANLTFPAAFARHLDEQPDAVAFNDVPWGISGLANARPLTYRHLGARAERAASMLEQAGVTRGDRVLLCVESREAFFAFFLGAQALGAVPVPLPAASESRLPAAFGERIVSVAADCAPKALVADDAASLSIVEGDFGPGVGRVDASQVALETGTPVCRHFDLDRSFDEWAFIQYTSGSTGSPKGVVITHGNLVANLRSIAAAGRISPRDVSIFWLPLFHDMGLVGGLLFGVYAAVSTYVLPPRSFVSRPDSWLRAMSQWKGTSTIAPNFAYRILAERLPDRALAGLDLTSWRLAFNGAEPIDKATVDAFIRRFEPHGFRATAFYPVYGMAETTLAIAFPVPGELLRYDTVDRAAFARDGVARKALPGADTMTFVSVGRAMPGHKVLIRSVGGAEELPERHIGEVVVSGPSVSPFYYAGRDGRPREELRTGDLGYRAGGDLYIVDRLKDLIIIAGRNLAPTDVERIAATVQGVRYGAVVAFSKPGEDGTEELFLVVGVEPGAAVEGMAGTVRRCVQEHFGVVPRDIVFVEPRKIPKTSSGKNRRDACRALYDSGRLVVDAVGSGRAGKAAVSA